MEDVRVGAAFRAVRIRRGWRQQDVAGRAGISRAEVSLIERGHLDSVALRTLRHVGAVLEIGVILVPRWRGADIDRLLNAGHARLHEQIATLLDAQRGWIHAPEVSFSIYGERGVIDVLALHAATGSLLVIELKTEIVSVEDLLTTMDRRARLARTIARDRGWDARTVSTWVVVAEGDSNRRRVRANRAALRSAMPSDGHTVRAWLRQPAGSIAALSFWADANVGNTTAHMAARKRVRNPSCGRQV